MNIEALKNIGQFSQGTGQYHSFRPFPMVITDGVKHLIENADAFWFLNIIGSYIPLARKDDELSSEIQHWFLRQGPAPTKAAIQQTFGKSANLLWYEPAEEGAVAYVVCQRNNGSPAIIQEISYTDFPFQAFPEGQVEIVLGFGADDINSPRVAALPIED